MKRVITSMLAACVLAAPGLAGATVLTQPGQLCKSNGSIVIGTWGSTTYWPAYSGTFGVYNPNTAVGVDVYCPVPTVNLGPSFPGASLRVITYDRNPIDDVICTMNVIDENGNAKLTSSQRSSGSNQAAQPLTFSIPAGTPGAEITLTCTIPVKYAALNAVSHVANYKLTY